jgi:hypothetical protein
MFVWLHVPGDLGVANQFWRPIGSEGLMLRIIIAKFASVRDKHKLFTGRTSLREKN